MMVQFIALPNFENASEGHNFLMLWGAFRGANGYFSRGMQEENALKKPTRLFIWQYNAWASEASPKISGFSFFRGAFRGLWGAFPSEMRGHNVRRGILRGNEGPSERRGSLATMVQLNNQHYILYCNVVS